MDIDPLTTNWGTLFKSRKIADIQKIRNELLTRRNEHRAGVAERIGARHHDLINIAGRIATLQDSVAVQEKTLGKLLSSENDSNREDALLRCQARQKERRRGVQKQVLHKAACRLLAFAEATYFTQKYVACARALYLCRELDDGATADRLKDKERRLRATAEDWIANGHDEKVSQEMLTTCIIVNRMTPTMLITEFAQKREKKISDMAATSALDALDLAESTLFSINSMIESFFKLQLARGKLINTSQLSDPKLGLHEFVAFFPERVLSLPSCPEETYQKTARIDGQTAQARAGEKIVKLLKVGVAQQVGGLGLADLTKLYAGMLSKVRDSSELANLMDGDLVGYVLHKTFCDAFMNLAVETGSLISSLSLKLGTVDTEVSGLPFDINLAQPVEDLAKGLSLRSIGAIGNAREPLHLCIAWADGVAEAHRQVDGLAKLAGLVSAENSKLKTELAEFETIARSKMDSCVRCAYDSAVEKVAGEFKSANDVENVAFLATVLRELSTKYRALGGDPSTDLRRHVLEKLCELLLQGWSVPNNDSCLPGFPSIGLLRGLAAVVERMSDTLPGFIWDDEALQVLRQRVCSQLNISGSDAIFAEKLLGCTSTSKGSPSPGCAVDSPSVADLTETEPVEPSKTEPAEPRETERTESTEPTEPTESSESTGSIESTEPAEPTGPIEPTETSEGRKNTTEPETTKPKRDSEVIPLHRSNGSTAVESAAPRSKPVSADRVLTADELMKACERIHLLLAPLAVSKHEIVNSFNT